MEFFYFILIFTILLLLTIALFRAIKKQKKLISELEGKTKEKTDAENTIAVLRASNELDKNQIQKLEEKLSAKDSELQKAISDKAALEANFKNSEKNLDLLKNTEEHLKQEFERLSIKIFEERFSKFDENTKTKITDLLNPVQENLKNFRERIDFIYKDESNSRTSLKQEVKQLISLNQTLSQDANNLAQALKGCSKTRGNWGEVILEKILSYHGFRDGHEYKSQNRFTSIDNKRQQPDVIIHLPQGKGDIVVDSKVTLTPYLDLIEATEDTKEEARKCFKNAVLRHIEELAKKSYQDLPAINSIEFVLMFMPIEDAFLTAIHEVEILEEASQRKVMLASPSTLMYVLQYVASSWRHESQNKNREEIVKQGEDLYTKFVKFTESLEKIGKQLATVNNSYDEAWKQFSAGKGNLIRHAEKLKNLGLNPNKKIADHFLKIALDDSEEEVEIHPLL